MDVIVEIKTCQIKAYSGSRWRGRQPSSLSQGCLLLGSVCTLGREIANHKLNSFSSSFRQYVMNSTYPAALSEASTASSPRRPRNHSCHRNMITIHANGKIDCYACWTLSLKRLKQAFSIAPSGCRRSLADPHCHCYGMMV